MLKHRLTSLLLFLFVLVNVSAYAQRDSVPLADIVKRAAQTAQTYPIEKVYLHTDKPYYSVGDTIWLKAYETTTLNLPSQLSRVIYVEIVNSNSQLVQMLALPVANSTAFGTLPLDKATYQEGNYHIRAYTKWMANYDHSYFFNKTIQVGKAFDRPVRPLIQLSREMKNDVPVVNAALQFNDENGKPVADRKINWSVVLNDEDVAKGKETTDKTGKFNISYVNAKKADLFGAYIKATLEGADMQESVFTFPLRTVSQPADVQFFPEGGRILSGVPTKIAVKAIASDGLGLNFNLTVVDNTGKTVATATAQHAGMGLFTITPESGKNYKATVNLGDETVQSYELPTPQTNGIALSVNNSDTARVLITMAADSAFLKSHNGQSYYIVARAGQTICYAAQTRLDRASYSAYIPSAKFPSGIVQFTLLANDGQPLSERLAFIRHKSDVLSLTMSSDKPVYPNRQKVSLSVFAKNNNAAVAGSDLSLTVIDENTIPGNENDEVTILSSLLLTSDLRGFIEQPNYYFNKVSDKTNQDLDLLMLTQGYRRFTYRDLMTSKEPTIYFLPEQGLEISGTLRTRDGMPVKGGGVTIQIPDKFYTSRVVTDAEGKFKFSNLIFADSSQVIVSAKSNYNSKNLMVMVDPINYPGVELNPDYPAEKLNIDTMMRPYLSNSLRQYNSSRMLNEVVIKAKAIPKHVPSHSDYPSLAGLSSIEARVVSGDRLKGCADVLSCLQTLASGVTYDAVAQAFYVSRDYNTGNRTPMSIFAQGMPVDINYLRSVNADQIESVEVFLKDQLGTVNNTYQTNGVIVVNMKEVPKGTKISVDELRELIPQPSEAKINPKGYNVAKSFYSPKYLVKGGNYGSDLRTTIYWNPKVVTDATGKATVEFYTADAKGTYKAIVEGFDKEGHLGRAIYRFKVQ